MKILTYSLLFLLFSPAEKKAHEYYFSNMTMERNTETSSLETEFRLFSDDLEKALGESDDFHLRLGDEREYKDADQLIFDYIFKHVQIEGDGWEDAKVNYIGKNVDNDITYIYIEYTNISKWTEVSIRNTLFFDLYPGQMNQLTLVTGNTVSTESTILDYPEKTINLSL